MCFIAALQYDDIHCFGYFLALAIMLKDQNARYVECQFSIFNQKVLDRVHDIFNIANIPYGPVDFAQFPQFVPLLQNCRLIVVDAKERGTIFTWKSFCDIYWIKKYIFGIYKVMLYVSDRHPNTYCIAPEGMIFSSCIYLISSSWLSNNIIISPLLLVSDSHHSNSQPAFIKTCLHILDLPKYKQR